MESWNERTVNVSIWMFPKMVVPNNHGVFLLKMIILGCFGGTTIFGNTHIIDSNRMIGQDHLDDARLQEWRVEDGECQTKKVSQSCRTHGTRSTTLHAIAMHNMICINVVKYYDVCLLIRDTSVSRAFCISQLTRCGELFARTVPEIVVPMFGQAGQDVVKEEAGVLRVCTWTYRCSAYDRIVTLDFGVYFL